VNTRAGCACHIKLHQHRQAHWIAKIHAALNEKELALNWLERGLTAGAIGAFYKDEPAWDPIRSDPRFAELVRRMGISS